MIDLEEFICSFCQRKYTNEIFHFENGQCIHEQRVSDANLRRIIFKSGKYGCKRCSNVCQDKFVFEKHQKSCKRSSQKAKSSKISGEFYNVPNKRLQPMMEQQKNLQKEGFTENKLAYTMQQLSKDCESYFLAVERPNRRNWILKNSGFKPITLFGFYRSFIETSIQKLSSILPEINISKLPKIKKISWSSLIKQPHEIFDKELIEKRLERYDEANRIHIKRILNKYYEGYPVSKFQLPKTKKIIENPTEKSLILPYELMSVLQTLISTQIRGFVHIAVDLFIIFQSGLRFPSSMDSITQHIVKFRQARKKKPETVSFKIISTKTQNTHTIVFDLQLIELLQIVDWHEFFLPKKMYERLSSFFPFSLLMMRRGYISFLYLKTHSTSQNLSLLSHHKSWKNAQIYVQKIIITKLQEYKADLRLCNIKTSVRSESLEHLKAFNITEDRIKLDQNWFCKAYSVINSYLREKNQIKIDILMEKCAFIAPQDQPVEPKIDFPQQKDDESFDTQEVIYTQQATIKDKLITLNNGRFMVSDLFHIVANLICSECDETGKYRCQFCGNSYCMICKPVLFCDCCRVLREQSKLIINSQIKSELKLKMPKQYIYQEEPIDQVQIRFLIYTRGYNFINCSVDYHLLRIPKESIMKIANIAIADFKQYQQMRYFPPIFVKIFGQSSSDGTGFGIFARENIEKNVLIGEYAGDIFNNTQLKFCRRKDMIFCLKAEKRPFDTINVGPIENCGYAPLINDLQKSNNCKAVIGLVHNRIRVLIYTARRVKKNQQLGYSYARQQEFREFSEYSESEQQEINQINIQQQLPERQNVKRLLNIKNNCYLNVVLQLMNHLKMYFPVPQSSRDCLFRQIRKLYKSSLYSPEKIMKEIDSNFQYGRQHDAHQFLVFIVNYFKDNNIEMKQLFGFMQRKITCQSCNVSTIKIEPTLEIFIDNHNSLQNPNNFEENIEGYACQSCQSIKLTSFIKYEGFGNILITCLKRFKGKTKDCSPKNIPKEIKQDQFIFVLAYSINHVGSSLSSGHYTFLDVEKRFTISDQKIIDNQKVDEKEAYILIYKKFIEQDQE